MSKLDDIIDNAYNREADLLISDDFKDDKVRFAASARYKAKTKRELKDLMLEVIGDDGDTTRFGNNNIGYGVAVNKNHLRAELRQKVEAL